MTTEAIKAIAAERDRQITVEGYDAHHDDDHIDGELAMAAACYAAPERIYVLDPPVGGVDDPFPWEKEHDKRAQHNELRRLAIAGALIVAEMDRLARFEQARIFEILREGYETEEEIVKYWLSPQTLLNGRTPEALVYQGRGAEVLALVKSLADGAYL